MNFNEVNSDWIESKVEQGKGEIRFYFRFEKVGATERKSGKKKNWMRKDALQLDASLNKLSIRLLYLADAAAALKNLSKTHTHMHNAHAHAHTLTLNDAISKSPPLSAVPTISCSSLSFFI